MAVAILRSDESHPLATTGSVSEASFSFTIAVGGTARGILVFTFVNANADDATAVAWGGLSLTAVTGGRAVDTAGEAGDCKAWFLGSGLASRADDVVVVTRNNTANEMYAVAFKLSAAADTEVYGTPVLLEENGTCAEQSIDDGSPGSDSRRFAGINSGLATVAITPASNTCAPGASSITSQSIDFGTRVILVVQEATAGQGARSVGFSNASSDDRAAVHLVVREQASVARRVIMVS